jgi:hypothetical protein
MAFDPNGSGYIYTYICIYIYTHMYICIHIPWSSEMASFDPNGSGSAQMRISASELNGTPLRARALLGLTPRHVCGGTWAHPCHDSGSPLGQFPRPRPLSGTGTALAQVKQTKRALKQTHKQRPRTRCGRRRPRGRRATCSRPRSTRPSSPARARALVRACVRTRARSRGRARALLSFRASRCAWASALCGVRCACQQPDRVGVAFGFVCSFVCVFLCLLGRPLLAFLACPARLPPRRSRPVDSGDASIRRLCVRGRPKQSNGRSFPWRWRLRLFRAVPSRRSARGRAVARLVAHVRAGALIAQFACLSVCLFVCGSLRWQMCVFACSLVGSLLSSCRPERVPYIAVALPAAPGPPRRPRPARS